MLHNTAVKIILISASAVIYCEFINYYFVIGQVCKTHRTKKTMKEMKHSKICILFLVLLAKI